MVLPFVVFCVEACEFSFTEIPPSAYLVSVNAQGFAPFASAEFAVTIGQAYELPDVSLSVATANTMMTVRPTELIGRGADKSSREAASGGRDSKLLYQLHL